MKLSVIIPAYDDLAGVLTCLNSLRAMQATDDVEYLVQDDAGPNALLPALIPEAVADTARNEVNLGFAGNANAGAARATGDVLFFVNQDVYGVYGWSDGWDRALLAGFEDPAVSIVAPRLLFPNGGIQSAGGAFDTLCQPVHRYLGWSNPHSRETSQADIVDWATGAALAVLKESFWAVGGFDTGYRMYFEDVDLCLKLRHGKLTVPPTHELLWACETLYLPACTLIHSVGSTGGSPHFMTSARRFKERWVDSGIVTPGRVLPTVRYW